MNSSEDGVSPLGEFSEVRRSGVDVLRAAADRVAAPLQACNEIRALHTAKVYISLHPRALCMACGGVYPCDTVAILDRHGV